MDPAVDDDLHNYQLATLSDFLLKKHACSAFN